jgi:type I restriction enzyme, R subunit
VLGQRYHLITRDDRLDAVAKDIVHHFLNRGYQGKAMVVSIDKLTTLRMYEKVRAEWEAEKARVLKALEGWQAVIRISPRCMRAGQSSGDGHGGGRLAGAERDFRDEGKGLRHPAAPRADGEGGSGGEVQESGGPFRLVFVCAMWLTGFDAPSCSTLYLDKPMRGHTLMQTIARANRVYGDKVNGLIVDYANVFQELEKALAIYGSGTGGGEMPVKDKKELVEALRIALDQVADFCRKQNVDLEAIPDSSNKLFIPAVNQLLRTDEVTDSFLGQANDVARLYKAVMPDPVIPLLAPRAQVIAELAKAVRAQKEPVNITEVMGRISEVLDKSIVTERRRNPVRKRRRLISARSTSRSWRRSSPRRRTRTSRRRNCGP